MLKAEHRLKRKYFKEIFDRGATFRGRYFILKVAKAEDGLPSRFGFSVSKKVYKSAVDRNRTRRQGYSALKNHIDAVNGGIIGLFSMIRTGKRPKFAEISQDIEALLRQSRLI
ncbi:MAG TPA: ribonuclease P protein component [Candidatus Paceibacterota bacterium]|jgi:ribonuclease P protein component|nr:ribonuclease P protein component [Candidatus Paceibacterota bacterium]